MTTDRTKIVMPGATTVTMNSTDLSLTATIIGHCDEYAASILFDTAWKEIKTHNSGDIPVGSIANGTRIKLELKLAEFDTADIHKLGFPFATHTSGQMTMAGPATVGVKAKVLTSVIVHLDADAAAETHDWKLSLLEIKNDSIKIVNKIGEKWVVDFKAEGIYNDATDMVTYGVPVP